MSTMGIIAYWPDRWLPDPKKNIAPLYEHEWFNTCLVGILFAKDEKGKEHFTADLELKA